MGHPSRVLRAARRPGLGTQRGWANVENVAGWVHPPPRARGPAVLGARTDGAAADMLKRRERDYASSGDVAEVERAIRREGYVVGEMTLTALMALYTKLNDISRSKAAYAELRQKQRHLSVRTFNTLLNLRALEGDVVGAKEVWHDLSQAAKPDAASYSIVMKMHRKLGRSDNACKVYRAMVDAGIEPTVHAVTTFIACCDDVREAREEAERVAQPWDERLVTALVRLYGKKGDRVGALNALHECRDLSNVGLWTAYMTVFIMHEHPVAELANGVDRALTHVPLSRSDPMFFGAMLKACHSTLLRVTHSRHIRECVALADNVILKARRASTHWRPNTLLHASKVWLHLLLVYEAGADAAATAELVTRIRDDGVRIDRALQECIDRVERARRNAPASLHAKPSTKEYIQFL